MELERARQILEVEKGRKATLEEAAKIVAESEDLGEDSGKDPEKSDVD